MGYERNLGIIGCQKIRDFVKNGGTYLGICAGAYFAGSFLEFAKGTKLEIIEKRNLALFEGTTLGSILKPYSEYSMKNVDVMATYVKKNNLPAIIRCNLGSGFAILSGVHFEKILEDSESSISKQIRSTKGNLNLCLKKLFNFI